MKDGDGFCDCAVGVTGREDATGALGLRGQSESPRPVRIAAWLLTLPVGEANPCTHANGSFWRVNEYSNNHSDLSSEKTHASGLLPRVLLRKDGVCMAFAWLLEPAATKHAFKTRANPCVALAIATVDRLNGGVLPFSEPSKNHAQSMRNPRILAAAPSHEIWHSAW